MASIQLLLTIATFDFTQVDYQKFFNQYRLNMCISFSNLQYVIFKGTYITVITYKLVRL